MEHRISVAMATYNGEQFIYEQLESIRTQSLPVEEVIITDDQSGDRTVQLVREYISEHQLGDCWRIESNPKNLGYGSNFMNALRKTTGDIMFFCDQDDIWPADRVEKMVSIVDEHPDCLLLGSEFEPFSTTGDALSVPEWELKMQKNDGTVEKLRVESRNIPIGCQGCTMCMRRELLDKIDNYWYQGWAHDEFVWKLALMLDGLYLYHGFTIKRRLHSGNASLSKMHCIGPRVKFLEDLLASHRMTLKFAEDIGASVETRILLAKHIRATQMRIDLLAKRRLYLTIPLAVCYSSCYHKKRAILMELKIALTQKL